MYLKKDLKVDLYICVQYLPYIIIERSVDIMYATKQGKNYSFSNSFASFLHEEILYLKNINYLYKIMGTHVFIDLKFEQE